MRRTLIALSLFTVCGVAPAAANPVFEAGEFHLELSGGATYLDLPALRSTWYLPGGSGERTSSFYDDGGWGAGGGATISGGLGDVFGIGQPLGVALAVRYAGFSQDSDDTFTVTVAGTSPEGTSALSTVGNILVSAEQDVTLWELTLTLDAPIALGEGWLLRPAIGPSLLGLRRSVEDRAFLDGTPLGGNQEDLDSFYAGGVVTLDLEASLGGGWSAGLGLLAGYYAVHHDYDAAVGTGFPGSGGFREQASDSAWRGRASLEVAYGLGWVALGVSGGVEYLSEAASLHAYDFIDVVNGDFAPAIETGGEVWGASAMATARIRF